MLEHWNKETLTLAPLLSLATTGCGMVACNTEIRFSTAVLSLCTYALALELCLQYAIGRVARFDRCGARSVDSTTANGGGTTGTHIPTLSGRASRGLARL